MLKASGSKQEDLSVIKAKDDNGLSLVVGGKNGKKEKDQRVVWAVESRKSVDRIDVGHKEVRKGKNISSRV